MFVFTTSTCIYFDNGYTHADPHTQSHSHHFPNTSHLTPFDVVLFSIIEFYIPFIFLAATFFVTFPYLPTHVGNPCCRCVPPSKRSHSTKQPYWNWWWMLCYRCWRINMVRFSSINVECVRRNTFRALSYVFFIRFYLFFLVSKKRTWDNKCENKLLLMCRKLIITHHIYERDDG